MRLTRPGARKMRGCEPKRDENEAATEEAISAAFELTKVFCIAESTYFPRPEFRRTASQKSRTWEERSEKRPKYENGERVRYAIVYTWCAAVTLSPLGLLILLQAQYFVKTSTRNF